jgi:hypothetical protein
LALSGHHQHPEGKTLAPWGSCNLPHVPNKPSTLPSAPENVQPVLGGVLSIKAIIPSAGVIPPRSNLCQSVLVRASFCLLHARAHHDVVLPLPSQQPSDGLFSPMEVRANHLPMCTGPLVPVRRAWSCTSKTTPSMGSSVLEIIAM